jgi:hypothetical protein
VGGCSITYNWLNSLSGSGRVFHLLVWNVNENEDAGEYVCHCVGNIRNVAFTRYGNNSLNFKECSYLKKLFK